MAKEEVDPIDLAALNFMFAIEQVDPRVARVVVTHVQWGPGKNEYDESTGDVLYKDKQYKEIEMVDCMKLKEDPDFENFHDSTKLLVESIQKTRQNTNFLCPINYENLVVRGHYGATYFDYVRIFVYGCDLGDECFPNQTIQQRSINYISMKAHPSLLSDDQN